MKEVFVVSNNVFSPIGQTSAENFMQLKNRTTGIKQHENNIADHPVYASLFNDSDLPLQDYKNSYTKFERVLIASISDAITQTGLELTNDKTILILSSTKGNISLLETETFNNELKERIALHTSAKLIAKH
ncbi:MAG: beta-ketoacyl synthase, partial [Panacibacter sp.]